MFLLNRPSEQRIRAITALQANQNFSYPEAGATQGALPAGYKVLHSTVQLGKGSDKFACACAALREWKMFDTPNVLLHWPTTPIVTGNIVAVLINHFGFWSLNFCRIVYVIDEDGPQRRFGFAYGTLKEHAERGEERFMIEWNRATDTVTYDILSFSKAANWKTRIAIPVARHLQKQFVTDSLAAMAAAV
jgi:uncharacterized protein (UPF0548 family)